MTLSKKALKASSISNLAKMSDDELIFLRARLQVEMRKRKIATAGDVGELRVIDHFRKTPGLHKLQPAPKGTQNVDALSNKGNRYSIKTFCEGHKTGTVYPDRDDENKQLFEFLLIVRLNEDWSLESIHQLSWQQFVKFRLWDKRMKAWYVGCSEKTLSKAILIYQAPRAQDA